MYHMYKHSQADTLLYVNNKISIYKFVIFLQYVLQLWLKSN